MITQPDAYCTWCDKGLYIIGPLTQQHRWIHHSRAGYCTNPTPKICGSCDDSYALQKEDHCGECLMKQQLEEGYDPYYEYA